MSRTRPSILRHFAQLEELPVGCEQKREALRSGMGQLEAPERAAPSRLQLPYRSVEVIDRRKQIAVTFLH